MALLARLRNSLLRCACLGASVNVKYVKLGRFGAVFSLALGVVLCLALFLLRVCRVAFRFATFKGTRVALSDIDRQLLQRCLARQPHAWEDFVDRFLGLVVHVVRHTSTARSIAVSQHDLEDLASEVFIAILADDYAALRRFRGQSSLATYLTVISRRVVVKELLKRRIVPNQAETGEMHHVDMDKVEDHAGGAEERVSNLEEVHRLLSELDGDEADIVRLYHLDSIGPALSRARAKMRRASVDAAASS